MKKSKKGRTKSMDKESKPEAAEEITQSKEDPSEVKKNDTQEIEVEVSQPTEHKEPSKEQEYYDRLVRLAADFDNYKKRVAKEKQEFIKYSTERLIKEIIPVVDNLERALESAKNTQESKSIVEGVELILNQLLAVLEKEGVESAESKGKEFDPLIHEAISQIPSDKHEPNTVMEEQLKAYFLNKKLIRPAKVIVSKEPIREEESQIEKGKLQENEEDEDFGDTKEVADE